MVGTHNVKQHTDKHKNEYTREDKSNNACRKKQSREHTSALERLRGSLQTMSGAQPGPPDLAGSPPDVVQVWFPAPTDLPYTIASALAGDPACATNMDPTTDQPLAGSSSKRYTSADRPRVGPGSATDGPQIDPGYRADLETCRHARVEVPHTHTCTQARGPPWRGPQKSARQRLAPGALAAETSGADKSCEIVLCTSAAMATRRHCAFDPSSKMPKKGEARPP